MALHCRKALCTFRFIRSRYIYSASNWTGGCACISYDLNFHLKLTTSHSSSFAHRYIYYPSDMGESGVSRAEFSSSNSVVNIERGKAASLRHFEQISANKLRQPKDYSSPRSQSTWVGRRIRESKSEFAEIQESLQRHIRRLSPELCQESLDAKAFKEFLRLRRHHPSVSPAQDFYCRPSKETQTLSRVHLGIFNATKQSAPCWSCCGNAVKSSIGCHTILRNKRTWSFLP